MFAEHQYFRKVAGFTNEPGLKFPKTASTALTVGALVSFSSGTLRMTQAGDKVLGICKKLVASTDSDYTSTTKIEVEVLTKRDEVVCPVSAGTISATSLGGTGYDVVSGGLSISLSATTNKDFIPYSLIGSETAFIMAACQTTIF